MESQHTNPNKEFGLNTVMYSVDLLIQIIEKVCQNGNKGKIHSDSQNLITSTALKNFFEKNPKKKKEDGSLETYRERCKFHFNVFDFPKEFDLILIENHGWYKPTNRGNNLNGVSMDHKISVLYGFKNEIDPMILSHPANCQLMQHSQNASKGKLCSLSIQELIDLIEDWKIVYGG